MPFTRSTYPVRAPQRESKVVTGRFTDTGLVVGDGVTSVTDESGTGVYTIKFDGRGALSDLFIAATAGGSALWVYESDRDLANREVELTVLDSSGAEELTGSEFVQFVAVIKDA